ncbi:oxygenase MpaB family protein [Gordonia shandongensis]|uniref:oxygenase MpaB family protein n=1 Tax=Gordonia shandongensis TaxID=376351 RepID=UPI00041D41AE|nr:oxygenase MpaB family protein [Gordonia shandongensis]
MTTTSENGPAVEAVDPATEIDTARGIDPAREIDTESQIDPVPGLVDDSEGASLLVGPHLRSAVMADFRRHVGSVFTGVFAGVLYDQVAYVPVAASVDRTRRFRDNFTDRALRSAFTGIPVLVGDAEERAAASEWLIEQHRPVHGTGVGEYEGVRYSALDPDLWMWIMASTIHSLLVSFPVATGRALRPAEAEAAYQYLRYLFTDLELPSKRSRLPLDYAAFNAYYEDVVTTKLESNGFLRDQFSGLTRLPLPTIILPPVLRPVVALPWAAIRPLLGRVVQICSAQIMHPQVLEMIGFELRRRHDWEFAVYSGLLRTAWRALPDRLRVEPMLYNRLRVEAAREQFDGSARSRARLRRAERRSDRQRGPLLDFYHRYRLDDFDVPEQYRGGCPMG